MQTIEQPSDDIEFINDIEILDWHCPDCSLFWFGFSKCYGCGSHGTQLQTL